MRARFAVVASVLLATGAVAQDSPTFYQPDLDRLEATLARVQPARVNFYSGDETPGCPALTAACRRAAYLRAGDMVLIRPPKAGFVEASFTAGGARSTTGWLPKSAVVAMSAPAVTLTRWRGEWVRDDEAQLTIKPGKRPGTLAVSGTASWGTHDPARVARGGIHTGAFDGQDAPRGDRLTIGDGAQDGCRVRLRMIGPYLAVADNNRCGGMNVSFSGVYRHPAKR